MYSVEPIYGAAVKPTAATKMYQIDNVYDA